MDLMRLKTVQWLTVLGAVAGVLGLLALWRSPYAIAIMWATGLLAAAFLLLEVQRDRLSVFFAGIQKFDRIFSQESNRRVLAEVSTEYCYLGIGFSTVLNTFRAWHESERK